MSRRKCTKESEYDEQKMKKRKKIDQFSFLPDDILLHILKRVPDVFLRYKAKYVSKRWFSIITNRILLHHASFILQKMGTFTTCLVDIREEEGKLGLQVKEQDLDIPRIGRIMSWCNEILLMSNFSIKESLYVFDLITKEGSYLPGSNASCGAHSPRKCGVALSFDGFKGLYKVIHLYMGPPIQCHILTLRRDIISRVSSKWKKMEIPYKNEGHHYSGDPVSIQGRYLYWDIYRSNHVAFMDIAKERSFQMSLPAGSGKRGRCTYSLFVMGGLLALFDVVSWDKAEIWILKDFKSMKWKKLQNWSFRVFPACSHYMVCGVISKRYIILKSRVDSGMHSYDVKYGLVKKLDIDIEYDDERCVVHSSAPSFI